MSNPSYNFKDNITIDNDKSLRWVDSQGFRTSVIILNSSNNTSINSHTSGSLILNSHRDADVIVGSRLGIDLPSTIGSLAASLTLPDGGYIGTASSTGSLGLSASDVLDRDKSSRILLHSNDSTTNGPSTGNLAFYAGNNRTSNTSGVLFYVTNSEGNELPILTMKPNLISFAPHINTRLTITDTDSSSLGEGSLVVNGGMSISGDLYVGGAFTNYSDIRLKSDVAPLLPPKNYTKTADFVESLRTVEFKYTGDAGETPHIGFIAQDFIEHYPQLLRQPDSEHYSLDYTKLTVLLVECIKELRQEIRELSVSYSE
jgi:hypothetical protein